VITYKINPGVVTADPDPDGQWVKRADHLSALAELEAKHKAELREAFEAGVWALEDGIDPENGGTIGGAFDSWLKSREGKK
jgi:hypothetical protein